MNRLHVLTLLLILAAPSWAGNDFTGDSNCVFVSSMDSASATGESLTVAASSEFSSSYAAWRAFNKEYWEYWATTTVGVTPCWLSYSWGGTITHVVTSYEVTPYEDDAAPKDWTFQGYNGSSWVTLDTVTDETGWSDRTARTFNFSNSTAYEAYRIYITANNGRSTTQLAKLRLFNANGGDVAFRMAANTHPTGTMANSQGSPNGLFVGNTALPTVDTTNKKEGSGSINFEAPGYAAGDYAILDDASGGASWPLKGATTNYSFSLTGWFRPESLQNASYPTILWSKSLTYWGGGHQLVVHTGGLQFWLDLSIYGYASVLSGSITISTEQWYFFAVTYDSADGKARLYVWDDSAASVLVNRSETRAPASYGYPVCDGEPWYIASSPCNVSLARPFDGNLDEVTIWNKALTADEIDQIRSGTYGASSSSQSTHRAIGRGIGRGIGGGL